MSKIFNGKATMGSRAKKRGSKPTYGEIERRSNYGWVDGPKNSS